MAVSINISPEKAVQAGARWRVVDGSEQSGGWLGSGAVVTSLEPRHYCIEFAPIPGWREPQGLKVRSVEGFTNAKTVTYQPLSCYALGGIPPQTAWHDQWLEFMLPVDEARMIEVRCEPRPVSEPLLDKETGIFRYRPDPADKFPFLVTLFHKVSKKKQTFEITPIPILPPEVDAFAGLAPQEVAPPNLEMARQTITLPSAAFDQEQELPLTVPMPFSIEEPVVTPTFLEIRPAARPAGPRMLVPGASAAPGAATSEIEQSIIDYEENEPELFNNVTRTTQNVRIIGESVILEEGSAPYDRIHENPAVKRLDIYAETVRIRNPLHLPQTTVNIYARELQFEDQGDSPSYLSTTPLDHLLAAKAAYKVPKMEGEKEKLDPLGRVEYDLIKAEDGKPGANGGNISLHIESLHAPTTAQKRFILTGGRGQAPGAGADGAPGTTDQVVSARWKYGEANLKNSVWAIVYGTHRWKDSIFDTTHRDEYSWKQYQGKNVQVWPADGEDATPAGTPGPGGNGGSLTTTLDIAALTDVSGGFPGENGQACQGGLRGRPDFSVMVSSHNINDWTSSRGWGCIDYVDFNGRKANYKDPQSKMLFGRLTHDGANAFETIGETGSPGHVTHAGHPLSWLHPLLLEEILKRVKHQYLLGDLKGAQEKLTEYAELLDIYRSLESWNDLDEVARLELVSIRNEMAGLISRLHSHLDYFGNPAGWVPMLSFEVNRTIFDNEIDRAMEILYLTYWLQEKAQGDEQSVHALEQMQVQLKDEIEHLKAEYTKVTQTLPDLEVEAINISNEINLLQEKLKNLEAELKRKAEKQLEPPWWKTGLKIAGTLLSVVPVYQPALGAVGGLMNLGADFDPDDPWKTVTGVVDVATAFSNTKLTQKKDEYEASLKKVDTTTKEFKALKSAQNLSDATTALSKGLEGVGKVLSERQAPQSEVEALLQKLKAESKEFQQLSTEISSLLGHKMDFARKIADALQLVAEIPNNITSNLLAIDSAESALAKGKNALHDGRLSMYLHAMERRAQERLLKYHYYLAKSYEYRLLQPYRGALDLDKIFDEMEQLAQLNLQGDTPYELSKEQFDSLKAVYRDMLSSITDEILDAYQAHPPELSAPRRFNLTPNEISRLNAGESFSLNLMDSGLFRLNEENVRIVDLEVESLAVSVTNGGARDLMEVDLRFEHSGISQLRSAERAISFRHPARENTNPIAWGARYDVVDKKLDPIKPSADSDSLLRSLLKSDTAATMMLYSRPAAWADLKVSREIIADSGTPLIKALRLKVSYDFTRRSTGITVLQIKAVPEPVTELATFKPYFMLDQEDLTGRVDGRGAFYRAYQSSPTMVQILAQERYGRWKFNRWIDQTGKLLGMTPCLKVKVSTDQVIKAVYKLIG